MRVAPQMVREAFAMSSLLTMPSTPLSSSVMATTDSASDRKGAPIGSGPRVPHKKETTMAVPPHTPWPVLNPIALAAMKLKLAAITNRPPARNPIHVNFNEASTMSKKGSTSQDDRKTPTLT